MMRLKQWRNVWLGAAAMLAAPLAHAQDAAREVATPADDVVMLPCDGQCVTTTPPKKIRGVVIRPPHWGPSSLQGLSGTRITSDIPPEGVVELQFTIKADGTVADDIDILCLYGPQSFATGASRAVRDWRFEPAMVNGKPIAITQRLRVYYGSGETQSARPAIVTGYNDAVEMIQAGKFDDADRKLVEMYRSPSMNFYEVGMLHFARASLAMQRRDCVEAQQLSRQALTFGDSLMRSTQESLFRLNIAASLCFGDVVGAAKTLGHLQKIAIGETRPLAAQIESLKGKIDQVPSYAMEVKIPAEGSVGVDIPLYRRDFTFTKVAGALSSFTASCRECQFASPITDKAEWHLPKGWSDCSLWVRGKPGTTFQIVQFAGAAAVK